MPADPERSTRSVFALRGHTFGEVAMAAFVLCVVSGVLLIPAYDARDGRNAIATWLLVNPGAVFLRNLHYWTAQVFLVGTILHIWDHLRAATERRVARGVWLRLMLSLPVVGFLMLSGFLLRGDADAQQAQRILHEVIRQVPWIGDVVATFVFGRSDQLDVLYVQHAATATIIVWLVIIEHVRRLWPRALTTCLTSTALTLVALFVSPGLHDGMDPRMKGPWYFLGLQEALHWTAGPLAAVIAAGVGLAVVWGLPRLSEARARLAKRAAAGALAVYVALCGVGMFQRGENWSWRMNLPDGASDLRAGWIVPGATTVERAKLAAKIPQVLGRVESCLACHGTMTGLGEAHRPESIGCASCHGGDVFALEPARAHRGLIRVPGNLADAPRTCGQAGCHSEIVPRVERSIMATFAGVIDVDRRVFGETRQSPNPPHVRDLGTSAADTHLRQLCANCHLGQTKDIWGAITEESRGGGCNACHLVYSAEAKQQLSNYEAMSLGRRNAVPTVHLALSINAGSESCFGCHSRSGRISTSYEGWHELRDAPAAEALAADAAAPVRQFRQLDDERVFQRVVPDVHHEGGLECIDCHTAGEVMGKGAVVRRKHEQVQIRCEDCHTRQFATAAPQSHDAETQTLLRLHQWPLAPGERLATTGAGDPLVHVHVDAGGRGQLRLKRTGKATQLRAPSAACSQGKGHERLSCSSCHTPWAPRCASCHTAFDRDAEAFDHLRQDMVRGGWQEKSGAFEAAPPTLGIRLEAKDATQPRGVIDTFVPGMIMELNRNRGPNRTGDVIFRRLYARTSAHTTRREARSCESCHSDPVALGYGRGALRYEIAAGSGRWSFTPEHGPLQDGLPADAWTGFLQLRDGMVSTREDVRPFTPEEQRRILEVGACLTCHAGNSPTMRAALEDFGATVARRSRRCAVPSWP